MLSYLRPAFQDELDFCRRRIQFGADGSIIRNGDFIYVLPFMLKNRKQVVDQFLHFEGEIYAKLDPKGPRCCVGAGEVISLGRKGFVSQRIIHLQRRWRQKRFWKQYQDLEGNKWWYYHGPKGKYWCRIFGDDPMPYPAEADEEYFIGGESD